MAEIKEDRNFFVEGLIIFLYLISISILIIVILKFRTIEGLILGDYGNVSPHGANFIFSYAEAYLIVIILSILFIYKFASKALSFLLIIIFLSFEIFKKLIYAFYFTPRYAFFEGYGSGYQNWLVDGEFFEPIFRLIGFILLLIIYSVIVQYYKKSFETDSKMTQFFLFLIFLILLIIGSIRIFLLF